MIRRSAIIKLIVLYIILVFLVLWTMAPFSIALLGVTVLLTVYAVLMVFVSGRHLEVRIEAGDSAERGSKISYVLTVINSSRIPVSNAEIELEFFNQMTGERSDETRRFSVSGKSMVTETLQLLVDHSGAIEVVCNGGSIKDAFGCFFRKCSWTASGVQYVFPKRFDYSIPSESLQSYDMDSFLYSDDQSGNDSSEVFDIRSYRAGDSMKSVHWKLSAKSEDLVVREASYPVETKVLLLIDKCEVVTKDEADALEDRMYSVSSKLLDQGMGHTLGWVHPESGLWEAFNIADDRSLIDAARRSLEVPFGESVYRLIDSFLSQSSSFPWTSYIIISNQAIDTEGLMQYGKVIVDGASTIQEAVSHN